MKKLLRHYRTYFLLLAIIWAVIIADFSTDRFNMQRTSQVIEPWLHWLMPTASLETIYLLHLLLRKLGHFSEYALFAALVFGCWAAEKSEWRDRWLGYSLIVVTLRASLDELLQSFTYTRKGAIADVLIDIAGGLFLLLLLRWIKREKFSPLTTKKLLA